MEKFNLEDILGDDNSGYVRNKRIPSVLSDIFGEDLVPVEDEYGDLVVYDSHARYVVYKHSYVVEEFEQDGVEYYIVMFNAPGNPPSNETRYLFLAP